MPAADDRCPNNQPLLPQTSERDAELRQPAARPVRASLHWAGERRQVFRWGGALVLLLLVAAGVSQLTGQEPVSLPVVITPPRSLNPAPILTEVTDGLPRIARQPAAPPPAVGWITDQPASPAPQIKTAPRSTGVVRPARRPASSAVANHLTASVGQGLAPQPPQLTSPAATAEATSRAQSELPAPSLLATPQQPVTAQQQTTQQPGSAAAANDSAEASTSNDASEQESGESEATAGEAPVSESGDAESGDAESGDAESGDTATAESDTAELEVGEPANGEPGSTEPASGEADAATGEPAATDDSTAGEANAGTARYADEADEPLADEPLADTEAPAEPTGSNRSASEAEGRPDTPAVRDARSSAASPKSSAGTADPEAGSEELQEPEAESAPRRPALSPQQQAMKQQVERCLAFYFNKPLNTRDDSAWSIMHSFLGFGTPTTVAIGSPQGQRTNAIGWMCQNRPCGGRQLLQVQNGLLIGREGPGFQGHPAQFLAMLAQVHVSPNYEIRVNNQQFKVQQLIDAEKVTCRDGMELTFKLISLSHYLRSNATWKNQRGETWDIPRLIRGEISEPINGAACGGVHRMMGLSCAVFNRHQEGAPIDGQWARAAKYVRDYHAYAFSLQNPDGSFSSDWFKKRANWGDNDRKIQTTGHILEWLAFSLPDDELHDPRLVKSVQFLTNLMISNRHYDWEVGPRGHAIRALRLYHERAYGGTVNDWFPTQVTRRSAVRNSR